MIPTTLAAWNGKSSHADRCVFALFNIFEIMNELNSGKMIFFIRELFFRCNLVFSYCFLHKYSYLIFLCAFKNI